MKRWFDEAGALDREDVLAPFRERFYLPGRTIYLDGNSLGLLSREAETAVLETLSAWRELGIGGWLEARQPWFVAGETLGAQMAALMGARDDEVVVTGSTTVNIYQLMLSFYRPSGRRTKILADPLNFPTDLYALQSVLQLHGLDPAVHLLIAGADGETLDEAELIKAMQDDVAVAFFPSVLYRSGQLLDLAGLTRAAHERGIVIGFDLCHSAGVIPHQLSAWDVDFAVWCTYKYLNGGPGAIAALYVNRRHAGIRPALAGWWGYEKSRQFDMLPQFEAAAGAHGFQISTPPILSAAALYGSLAVTAEAGVERIRAKSERQTAFLIELIDACLPAGPEGFEVVTPRQAARRGGHVAIRHPEAVRIGRALRARGVVPDFRPPHILRLAPNPLYTSFHEIVQAVACLQDVMATRAYLTYPAQRETVG